MIQGVAGIPLCEQRLLLNGLELRDADALGDACAAGVQEAVDVTMTMIRRSEEEVQWLEEVQSSGKSLRRAPEHIRENREVVLKAVQQDGRALQSAAPELCADPDIVHAAVSQNGQALQHAALEFRGDPKFVLS